MLKRGFKSWSENVALAFRRELGQDKTSPLCPKALAKHLKIQLLTPSELQGLSETDLKNLLQSESDTWSAVTITNGLAHIIIYNSSHSTSRQSNNIMHELAHIIIGHKPPQNTFSQETGIFLRHYDQTQEEEADCLAAILLLPRDVLFKIKFSKSHIQYAAREYGVSKKLLEMRLNTSGINYIYKRSNR